MSTVTSVILICGVSDRHSSEDDTVRSDVLKSIDAWLLERRFTYLEEVEASAYGSGKVMECFVLCKGYNHFDAEGFGRFVASLDWLYPENVVLVMEPQEGATIVVRPEGYWTNEPPLPQF